MTRNLLNLKAKLWLWVDNFCARLGFLIPGARLRYTYNPLLKFPRNADCFCGSGFKFKTCCLHKLKKTVPIDQAVTLHRYMAYVETQVKK